MLLAIEVFRDVVHAWTHKPWPTKEILMNETSLLMLCLL